ncbi:MAG: hypothetical protein HYV95_11065 [Opitutae bacterium]|nr:hypothetical protein [Opitutae bacterium]
MRLRLARVFCGLLFLVAGSAARAELSPQTRAKINASFPAYRPNPPEPKKPETSAVGDPHDDNDVVKLPRFYVEDSKLGRADPDALLSRQGRTEKALRQYRASMNPLEWALNSWHIPFLTPSAKARANAAYDERKSAAEARRLAELQAAPGN